MNTGDEVYYYEPSDHSLAGATQRDVDFKPEPKHAIVAYVWSEHVVNLTILGHDGLWYARTSVMQTDPDEPSDGWLPK